MNIGITNTWHGMQNTNVAVDGSLPAWLAMQCCCGIVAAMDGSVRWGVIVVCMLMFAGCGDDRGGKTLTDGDADACEQDCEAQAAPNCERMPPDYLTSCKLFCGSIRESTPENCQAALRAQYQCAVDRAEYICVDGLATVMPQGVCANEGAACASCRGSLCIVGF